MHHPAQPEENMQKISKLLGPSLKNQVNKNLTKITSSFRKCFLQLGIFAYAFNRFNTRILSVLVFI
jgi:vacuolar-type H+-ATPase catalytic subunit A/Vma1